MEDLVQACEPRQPDTRATPESIQACYRQRLVEILHTQGSTIGMRTLYELTEASPRFASLCHVTAHRISELMYESVGNIPDAMGLCQNGCAYACPHAVIRSYLRSLPQATPPDVRQLCPHQTREDSSITQWHCTHGVGHGLAHYFPDFRQALSACRQFPLYWEHRRCIQGVFMELTIMAADTHVPSSQAPPTLALCRTVEPDERFDCYNRLISLVGRDTEDPTPLKFRACNAIPPPDRPGCYFGIGRSVSESYFEREEELTRVCRSGDTAYETECLLGFVSVLINYTNPGRGLEFCGRLHYEARMRCTESMGRAIHFRWPDQDRVAIECAKAGTATYVRACRDVTISPEARRSERR